MRSLLTLALSDIVSPYQCQITDIVKIYYTSVRCLPENNALTIWFHVLYEPFSIQRRYDVVDERLNETQRCYLGLMCLIFEVKLRTDWSLISVKSMGSNYTRPSFDEECSKPA